MRRRKKDYLLDLQQSNVIVILVLFVFKMKERAIQTLGYFPVGDEDFPHQKLLLQGLMDSVEVRN